MSHFFVCTSKVSFVYITSFSFMLVKITKISPFIVFAKYLVCPGPPHQLFLVVLWVIHVKWVIYLFIFIFWNCYIEPSYLLQNETFGPSSLQKGKKSFCMEESGTRTMLQWMVHMIMQRGLMREGNERRNSLLCNLWF